eukprot:31125-Pelagococcus_subviridis.AAC.33
MPVRPRVRHRRAPGFGLYPNRGAAVPGGRRQRRRLLRVRVRAVRTARAPPPGCEPTRCVRRRVQRVRLVHDLRARVRVVRRDEEHLLRRIEDDVGDLNLRRGGDDVRIRVLVVSSLLFGYPRVRELAALSRPPGRTRARPVLLARPEAAVEAVALVFTVIERPRLNDR